MSDVAQKARFNIERCVPRLREWEELEIFTKEEIRAIVKQINDFEYKVLSPGSTAADFLAFAKWEQSLEALRKKRCKRLKVKHVASEHAGQTRVMKIFERGTYRHPGSRELWQAYLHCAAQAKATRRWRKIMTQALRMMPTDPQLWILAGRQSAKNRDMNAARIFFMRGCRFCSQDATLWIEYARCEMEWLRRAQAKSGTSRNPRLAIEEEKVEDGDAILFGDPGADDEDEDNDMLIPEPSVGQTKVFNSDEKKTLAQQNPALDGAIPLAIFDVARKQAFFDAEAAEAFFIAFENFADLPAHEKISQHVLDTMADRFPDHPSTCYCRIVQPTIGVNPHTAAFPRALVEVLHRLKASLEVTTDVPVLKKKVVSWIDSILEVPDLDDDIRRVLEHKKTTLS